MLAMILLIPCEKIKKVVRRPPVMSYEPNRLFVFANMSKTCTFYTYV